jgi:hypothetical protein
MTEAGTDGPGAADRLPSVAALRTPRAAALAGIVFSVLLIAAISLLNLAAPSHTEDLGTWIADPHRRGAIVVALNLVPFSGIAFLWFVGVVRDRIGDREDRFFATVFFGSALLFVGMMFVAAAMAGGLLAAAGRSTGAVHGGTLTVNRGITALLLHVYAMRMAAVFTIATANITIRTRVVSRWIAVVGVVVGVVLLVSVGLSPWVELFFPAWILLLSADILWRNMRAPAPAGA